MKKGTTIFLAIAILALLLCGCNHAPQISTPKLPNETPENAIGSKAPGEAYSEVEFLQGILTNEGNYAAWGLLDHWEYYYRPTYIPEGFKLDKILFAGGYLAYNYSNQADELYEFIWNVTLREEAVRGYGKELEIPGAKEDVYIVAACGMDFSEAKNNTEYRESRKNSAYNDGWSMTFITEETVFEVGMPFSINEEDLSKMLQIERVYINK